MTISKRPADITSPSSALAHGISMLHQEISLVPQVTVAENIWLGREDKFTSAGFLSVRRRARATRALLDELGLPIDPNARVEYLNATNMQMVEIVRAVSYDSKIIIMDEPHKRPVRDRDPGPFQDHPRPDRQGRLHHLYPIKSTRSSACATG